MHNVCRRNVQNYKVCRQRLIVIRTDCDSDTTVLLQMQFSGQDLWTDVD